MGHVFNDDEIADFKTEVRRGLLREFEEVYDEESLLEYEEEHDDSE